MTRNLIVVSLLSIGLGFAQAPSAQRGEQASETGASTGETAPPCQIDERLSLWLGLEAADRTIAALEGERRRLAIERSEVAKKIELLRGAASGQDESLGAMAALIEAGSRDDRTLDETYLQLDARIADIEKTVKRRRELRARTEAKLEQLLGDER